MTMISVYADWEGLAQPKRLGYLQCRRSRAHETFEFQYDPLALADPGLSQIQLDPAIQLYEGSQYSTAGRSLFGIFEDSSPDRWGRLLMKRRLERDIRAGLQPAGTRLHQSDFLLGVHDLYRPGALRYRLEDRGEFLDNRIDLAAPPFTEIATLERASRALEDDADNNAPEGQEWLKMLIAPGGSLGGARPKASVVDTDGHLYIAKFPSIHDEHNIGGWEMLVNALATACDLNVAKAVARKFASNHHCFMVRRFDRTAKSKRLHFASAMTMTGHTDGEDASTGVSYLELAEVLIRHGSQTNTDLRELWSRIVFNMLVSNTDDHLRNHGFILVPGKGWRLSAAYDLNPVPFASGLKLNVTEADNALDIELTREIAPFFRLTLAEADSIIERLRAVVVQWRVIAAHMGFTQREQEKMADAFRLA
ncbi:type II toxin-antitoxin system HipA family toxin [Kalamiella sp. sgz302252]|uniref:type II toxin-antitoxin system HipA family toxin n=1 Tax=Pantoea sp. sgz302252 TaxID=3341827 RepID=UPI0036D40C13